MTTPNDLFQALQRTADFTHVVDSVVTDATKLRFLGRVGPHGGRRWLRVVDRIHEWADRSSAPKVDTSKMYFRREGQLIFGWRIILEAPDLPAALAELVAALDRAPPPDADAAAQLLDEYPLPGASSERNLMGPGRRGAALFGTAAVGPMAISMKRMGG